MYKHKVKSKWYKVAIELRGILMGVVLLHCSLAPTVTADDHSRSTIEVTWVERFGFIIHDSICADHDAGSIERSNCQRIAKKMFIEQCEVRLHKDETDEQRAKYCRAAKFYNPD
ncbi:MAG: hypothetical protein AB8B79_15595 [Granulosicoccus sp.]